MNFPEISPTEALERLKANPEARLIDVRQPQEFEHYRAPDATLIPLGELPARHAAELDPDAHYLVVCERGGRSAQACGFLASQGYSNVVNIAGGMSAWAGAGLPLAETSRSEQETSGEKPSGGGFFKRLFGGG